MYIVILKKNDQTVKVTQFSERFVAVNTFKLWDRKFSIDKGYYIIMKRI